MATKTPSRPRRRVRIPWRAVTRVIGGALAFAVIALGLFVAGVKAWPDVFFWLADRLPRQDQTFASDEEFFKYGSLGNEGREGLPFKVWKVLPKVCSKLVGPEGYRSFGFVFEPGKDVPIGFSKVNLGGIEQVAINCAVCHVERYRLPSEMSPRIFVGGAANTLDSERYLRFLAGCAATKAFETEPLIAAMTEDSGTTWGERQMFRLLLPIVRDGILDQARRYSWTWRRPLWGPGRVDPFNPVKFSYLKQPIDDTIGNSDMMPVWNAALKEGIVRKRDPNEPIYWHWDGLSADLREVIINSALGDGMTLRGYRAETIDRLFGFLQELKSPTAPIPVDPALKAQGEALFQANCASCHANDGPQVLTLIPIDVIGTDDHRLKMWTKEASDAYNLYDKDHEPDAFPWVLDKFGKHEAYLAQPLNGIWLTGPYLHNGSVPTLDDLLKPGTERPKAFLRGPETIDFAKGGFVAPPCAPEMHAGPEFCYDTSLPGNRNQGHEYGIGLTEAERRALVHYLLTL